MLQGRQQNVRIGKQRRFGRPLGKGAPGGKIGADLMDGAELDLVAAAGLGPGRPRAARGETGPVPKNGAERASMGPNPSDRAGMGQKARSGSSCRFRIQKPFRPLGRDDLSLNR
jgi:hypothetical protein